MNINEKEFFNCLAEVPGSDTHDVDGIPPVSKNLDKKFVKMQIREKDETDRRWMDNLMAKKKENVGYVRYESQALVRGKVPSMGDSSPRTNGTKTDWPNRKDVLFGNVMAKKIEKCGSNIGKS